jgi:cytochrome c oxidase subunit IV
MATTSHTNHAHADHAGHADHADHGEHHAHVIVPPITLKLVLGILLFFTVLTVGTAQLEVWAMSYFGFELPRWINVFGAMLIATIKAVLVMAYFMQLRYDNPMNSMVMVFTFFAVGLFLFFTSLDLFTRKEVYDFKSTVVVAGGMGGKGGASAGVPLVTDRRNKYIEDHSKNGGDGQAHYNRVKSLLSHKHHGSHEDTTASSAQRSRPRVGLTLPKADAHTAPAAGHGHEHKPEAKPQTKPADSHTGH